MRHPLQFAILMKIRHLDCKWSPLCRLQKKGEREGQAKEIPQFLSEGTEPTDVSGYCRPTELGFQMIEVGKKEFLSFSVRGQGSSHMVKECRNDVCCCGNPKTRLPPWEARTHKPTPPHDEANKGFWPRGASRLTPAVGARWGASWGCQSTAFTGCLWEAEGTKWDRLFTRERETSTQKNGENESGERGEEVIQILSVHYLNPYAQRQLLFYSLA